MFRIIAIIVATIALAYAAWASAAVQLYSKFAPEYGLRLDPSSARALIGTIEKAGEGKDKSVFLKVARPRAVRAIRSEPLSVRAVRQLGTYYAMTGDKQRGRNLIKLSATLSRRDAAGQLWLADDHLRRGEAEDALRSIDVVIRTQPETNEAAFRVLGSTLADPEFRQTFVAYAKSKPLWLRPFVEYNIGALQQPEILSRMLVQLRPLSRDVLSEDSAARLLSALADRSPISDVRAFYLKQPGASEKALQSLDFARTADSFRYPPVGWQMMNSDDVQGFGDIDGNSISIEAIVMPGRHGIAARKLLLLPAGRYRWTGSADLTGLNGGTASLGLLCNAGPGKWVRSTASDLQAGRNSVDFTVPTGCPAQLLTIEATGADSQTEGNLTISKMRLAPAGARPAASAKAS